MWLVVNMNTAVLPGTLGAKPKNKSLPREMGGGEVLTGAQRSAMLEDGLLPSKRRASSASALRRAQLWTTAKSRVSGKPPEQQSTAISRAQTSI